MERTLLVSFAVGFLTASPFGPVGLICLRRTLARGVRTGLISALGIATAYGFWSFVAAHGVAAASNWIEEQRVTLEVAIGTCFVLFGLNGALNTPRIRFPTLRRRGWAAEFLSTFLIVFLNPATFLLFSALFTLLGVSKRRADPLESLEVAGAVAAGALTFWSLAARAARAARDRIHEDTLQAWSRISSVAIALFGAGVLTLGLVS